MWPKRWPKGKQRPRIELRRRGRPSPQAADVFALGERCGVSLLPWQRHWIGTALQRRRDRWTHSRVVVSVARQQGKSLSAALLMLWWVTEWAAQVGAPQTVVFASNKRVSARQLFLHLERMCDQAGLDATVRRAQGSEEFRFPDGSAILLLSSMSASGHGLSIDLAFLDELWDLSAEFVEDGILPAMRARPDPLVIAVSTAGTADSELFRRWRGEALQAIETGRDSDLAYLEWSPPPDCDPADPAAWAQANPSLGTLLRGDTLRDEYLRPNRAAFLRASLNLWLASVNGWLPAGLLDAITEPVDLDPGVGVLALEVARDFTEFGAVQAVRDGDRVVARSLWADDLDDAWVWLREHHDAGGRVVFGASLDALRPPELYGVGEPIGNREAGYLTPMVRRLLTTSRVAVAPSTHLAEDLARAVARSTDAGTVLSAGKSNGSIALARALVFAVGIAAADLDPGGSGPSVY